MAMTPQEKEEIASIVSSAIKQHDSKLYKVVREAAKSNSADKIRQDKILKNTTNIFKEFDRLSKNLSSQKEVETLSQYSSILFKEAMESIDSVKELDRVFKQIPNKISKSIRMHSTDLANSIKDIKDVFNIQKMTPFLTELNEDIKLAGNDINKLKSALDKAKKLETDFGVKLSELGMDVQKYAQLKAFEIAAIQDGSQVNEDLQKEIKQSQEAMEGFNKAIIKTNKTMVDISKQQLSGGKNGAVSGGIDLAKTSKAAIQTILLTSGAKQLYEAMKAAGKFGVALDPVTAAMSGLSMQELPELQAKFNQTAMAIGGMAEFSNILKSTYSDTNSEFVSMSGGLKEAAIGLAQMTENVRSFGVANINTTEAVKDEQEMFIKFHRQMAMTTDQFTEMTAELINDADIREQLKRLNESQRKAYIDNNRLMILNNYNLGVSTEKSKAMIKAMAGIAGMDPAERMKKAVRIQVLGAAMGMKEAGDAAAKLVREGSFASSETREAGSRAMIELEAKSKATLGETRGKEFVFSTMLKDVGDIFKDFTAELEKGRAIDQKTLEKEKGRALTGTDSPLGNILKEQGWVNEKTFGKFAQTADAFGAAADQGALLMSYTLLKVGQDIVDNNYGGEITTIMNNWDRHGIKVWNYTSSAEDAAKAESKALMEQSKRENEKFTKQTTQYEELIKRYEDANALGSEGLEQQKGILKALDMIYGMNKEQADLAAKSNTYIAQTPRELRRMQHTNDNKRKN